MVSKFFVAVLFAPLLAIPSAAQPAAQTDQQAATSANPLSTWLRNAYMGNRNVIVRSAEKMPEENYGMRPGTQPEVRTFGQQVGHIANYNFMWCAQAKGGENPNARNNLVKLNTKHEYLKALTDAFAC